MTKRVYIRLIKQVNINDKAMRDNTSLYYMREAKQEKKKSSVRVRNAV